MYSLDFRIVSCPFSIGSDTGTSVDDDDHHRIP